MADDVDHANRLTEEHLERSIAAAHRPIAPGVAGMCEACCDDHPRLVRTAGLLMCARCRDRREARNARR